MKRFFCIFAVIALVFVGCSQNFSEVKIENSSLTEKSMTQEERARKVVLDMLNRIDPQTRGYVRKIASVEFITFEQMFGSKSRGESDSINWELDPNPTKQPGLGIINFQDSTGYAIIDPGSLEQAPDITGGNGDSEAVTLLAITDSGNISTDEILSYGDEWMNNSGNGDTSSEEDSSICTVGEADEDTFVTSLLYSYVYNKTYCPDFGTDSPEDDANMDSVNDVAMECKGPLVSTKWKQTHPFNARVETYSNNGPKCPVGCTVIATAQVLTYFANRDLSWFFGVTNSTWSTFINTDFSNSNSSTTLTSAESDVSKFTKEIADGIGVNYKEKGSGAGTATPLKVKSYVKNDLLYSVSLSVWGRKAKRLLQIVNSINNNKPVIIFAGDSTVFLGGHSWIIDGYMQNDDSNEAKHDYYVHCNYGWGGKSDGWYFIDLLHNEKNENEWLDDTSVGEASFNFNYMFSYLFFN